MDWIFFITRLLCDPAELQATNCYAASATAFDRSSWTVSAKEKRSTSLKRYTGFVRQGSARSRAPNNTSQKLQQFDWEIMKHSLYSLDIVLPRCVAYIGSSRRIGLMKTRRRSMLRARYGILERNWQSPSITLGETVGNIQETVSQWEAISHLNYELWRDLRNSHNST